MKCQLLRTHLTTREDAFELIRRKKLCLGCMKKIDNNSQGEHHCVLVVERPNKEKFSVLCPLNCRYAGTLLNRFWCRCAIKKMKSNVADTASSSPANVSPGSREVPTASNDCIVSPVSSSSQIVCNNIVMGSSCRASESLTVVDKSGRRHVCCLLYESGGSTTLTRPSFSQRAHYTRQALNDSFTIVTETSREVVEAIRFSFLVDHPDGGGPVAQDHTLGVAGSEGGVAVRVLVVVQDVIEVLHKSL